MPVSGERDIHETVAKTRTRHSKQRVYCLRGHLHPKSLGVWVMEVNEFGQEKYDGSTPEN